MKNHLYAMFSNISKGQLARRNFIFNKRKKICESFLQILWNEGFILGYRIESDNPEKLRIFLKYKNGKPAISFLKPISKPSLKIFYSIKQIWKIDSSKIFMIFSTNKGLKSIMECKKLKTGGRPYVVIH